MFRQEITREATLGQLLDETVAKCPDTDAVVYADRNYRQTWREFSATIDRVAKGLMALGVKKGEKVAVWATNVPHWVTLQFATARIGAILLTININYKRAEIDYVLKQSETENIFIIDGYRDTDYLAMMYDLVPELKERPRGQLRSANYPHLKRVLFLGPEKHRGLYAMDEVMDVASQTSDAEYRERQSQLSCYDVVNMQYTSGTTGFPKGVMLTHHNIGNNGYWIGSYMNFGPQDRICIPVPLFHCFGCVLGVMSSLNTGATMVILEKYDPVNVMMSVEKERCTALYGVPTMFITVLDHPLFSKFDFSTLRTGIMAGSPCPVKSMHEVVEKMNMSECTIVFGLTESSPGMTQTRWDEPDINKKCSTVGQPLPGVEVKLFDPDTGKECGAGEHGEVCCRGYNVMKGYYKMPVETEKAIDKNGWLHSGDIGMMDKDGYLSITGRLKDMIIRGGENIYPKEVEDFIHHMPGVQDVQVVGVPSKKYGEQPGAYVILYPHVQMTPEDVQDFCRGQIAFYKIPKYVAFVDSFPLTASGKIMKYKLREDAAKRWPDA
ncbi:AMP-binding protein [Methanomassiliicoccus luminyensis]|uniref:AMP-binding protein n=1 Tax=Methanomassiliicoccus luminyensis TaxID=1080712 RepID=UPI00036C3F60|nr:AMP-binding protein [Methanomassiliicoccus luminyensis]